MMRLLYFAWVRERMDRAEEEVALPAGVTTVAGLLAWLRGQEGPYDAALGGPQVRVAVNQVHAGPEVPVREGDEVAFFPPVSGGDGR